MWQPCELLYTCYLLTYETPGAEPAGVATCLPDCPPPAGRPRAMALSSARIRRRRKSGRSGQNLQQLNYRRPATFTVVIIISPVVSISRALLPSFVDRPADKHRRKTFLRLKKIFQRSLLQKCVTFLNVFKFHVFEVFNVFKFFPSTFFYINACRLMLLFMLAYHRIPLR